MSRVGLGGGDNEFNGQRKIIRRNSNQVASQ